MKNKPSENIVIRQIDALVIVEALAKVAIEEIQQASFANKEWDNEKIHLSIMRRFAVAAEVLQETEDDVMICRLLSDIQGCNQKE